MEVPQKVKNRTTLLSSNCTMRYPPKGYKNTDLKRHMDPDVYSSIIKNSQTMERAHIIYIICIYNTYTVEYYSSTKKNDVDGARVCYVK